MHAINAPPLVSLLACCAVQGDKRISLDVWEPPTRTLNPLSEWRWADVIAYVDAHGVPVNAAHNYVFRSNTLIDPKKRHLPNAPWTKVDLGKPFWRVPAGELAAKAPHTFVFKSFGDTHTSVPVLPHESEVRGRVYHNLFFICLACPSMRASVCVGVGVCLCTYFTMSYLCSTRIFVLHAYYLCSSSCVLEHLLPLVLDVSFYCS